MSAIPKPRPDRRPEPIVYPESDGKPMADNTKQFEWIYRLYGNLAAIFQDHEDVFVCGNQFWYPVEGEPQIVQSPDVYVVFGRPKGHRPSWKQWEEGGVPMTVVFEVLSPGNNFREMADKLQFYDDHGVEEYYVYDPDNNDLAVYVRGKAALRLTRPSHGFVSPRLGIRFDLSGEEMAVYHPDGRRFLTFEEAEAERSRNHQLRLDAEKRIDEARQRIDAARKQADEANRRVHRLAELSRKARRGEATAEEIAELERLEELSP
jgi:Uma2 family endonuclease